jgi:RNA polymerase sigma-70 factor (sigma-E family)
VAGRQARLRRVAYAVCGDWERAEDLLQTALTKLYVAWPRVARDGREDAYVRQVIVRANLDEVRRPWRRRESPGLVGVEVEAGAGTSVEDRSELLDALLALPEMQRKVVVLRHWLGLSVEETAADLRIAPGTVKSHSHRGLAALQARLAPEPPRPSGVVG